MLGGAFGQGVGALLPNATGVSGAYAMVGMAAVFAAAGQAPISAILILFEMTNDYRIILPLMLACIVATTLYSIIQHDSIYSVKIRRKGIDLADGRDRHLLERIHVTQAMVDEFVAVRLPPDVGSALDRLRRFELEWLVLVDENGRYCGLLTREQAERAADSDDDIKVEDLVDTDVVPLIPTESLDDAYAKMAPRGLRVLPVIEDLVAGKVIGVVTRESLGAAYWTAVAGEHA
jgi:CIC family chloride channel protein